MRLWCVRKLQKMMEVQLDKEHSQKKGCISELSFESLVKLNTRLNSSVSVSSDIVALAASRDVFQAKSHSSRRREGHQRQLISNPY